MASGAKTREQIIAALRGQTFVLPEFEELFKDWPQGVSPHLESLRVDVESHIASLLTRPSSFQYDDPARKKKELVAIDLPYFVATWWPHASRDSLFVLARCALWLFMWDDEIDSSDASLGRDAKGASEYRKTTLEYVRSSLGLVGFVPNENVLITSFDNVSDALGTRSSTLCQRFYDEIEHFINATEAEQARRGNDKLPNLHEYLVTRLGTSGVNVLSTLYDLIEGVTPHWAQPSAFGKSKYCSPASLGICQRSASSEHVWRMTDATEIIEFLAIQCNTIISVKNDILSLNKEVIAGAVDSSIPILYMTRRDVRQAVQDALGIILKAKSAFDEAAAQLEASIQARVADTEPLRSFLIDPQVILPEVHYMPAIITALRTMVTGNIAWSMTSERYGLQDLPASREVVLGQDTKTNMTLTIRDRPDQ